MFLKYVLLFKFQTTSFFLSVFLRRQLRMHTALNLIKAPLKKCQTGILKYSACILKERNQNGYLLVEWQAGAQQYEQKIHGGHKLKQFFIKKSLEKGLPPFWLYGVALLHLDSLSHTFVELAIRFVKCPHNTKEVLVDEHTKDGSTGSRVLILASSAPNPL